MERIQDYEILEKLIETRDSFIYRGRKEGEDSTVIVKVLKMNFPSATMIARFKQDYKIIMDMDFEGIIKTHEIICHDEKIVLILEDFNGIYLCEFLEKNNTFNTESFLKIGISISEAIGEFHKRNIIHRNINPDTILIDPNNSWVKITGFGTPFYLEYSKIWNSNLLQDSLLYISPEQTGRMNHVVDYRTDLYSLGVTFYKMITGVFPFESNDLLEIIHSHIAREPVPPIEQRENIPKIISDIVMKLMSKNPDDRYQSAFGLMSDLKECLKRLDSNGKIQPFELAKRDISSSFIIPQKLFGRDKEIDILISAFDRVSNINKANDSDPGSHEFVLITGSPGTGKSAVVNEIYKPVNERKGYFISGKYEQFRSDTPHSAIVQAFQKLLRLILSESDEKINIIREEILEAIGINGKIITDIIPDLELIIGKQPEPAKVGSDETRNRFNIVFEKFINVFTKKEHPIVLFLDDLHWADIASLQLIGKIVTSHKIRYLFIIGSYRDNEVSELHPLTGTLKEIEKAGIRINRITLSDLTVNDVKDLIVNFLKCSEDSAYSLSELICRKTGGNPFFVNEFLHTLYNEKLIEIDSNLGWKWDIYRINQISITDNLVEFLSHKIIRLPERLQQLLKISACIGNRFDLETLASLLSLSIDKSLILVNEAIDEGFIRISGNLYIFAHDRIQEAAYSLLPDEEKPLVHYRIGKLILDKTDESDLQNRLFYIVDQLNFGSCLITDTREREELARLNCECGIKAKKSAAYSHALNYFKTGISLLEEQCWESQYDLTLSIHTEAVEIAFLSGDFNLMERYASMVIDYVKKTYEAVPVYKTIIRTYIAQNNIRRALDTILDVFEKLGFSFPENPSKIQLLKAWLKIRPHLSLEKIDSLIDLPEMTDPHNLAIAQMITLLGITTYIANPKLMILTAFTEIWFSIKHGLCNAHAFGYIGVALVLADFRGDIEVGYKLGNLALRLVKKINAVSDQSKAICLYNQCLSHWKDHLKTIRPDLMKSYYIGIETGDLYWSAASINFYDYFGILVGNELTELEQQMSKNNKIIKQLNQKFLVSHHCIYWQTVLNLLGRNDSPMELTGTALDEKQMRPSWEKSSNGTILGTFYINRLVLRYIFCDYQRAIADFVTATGYLSSLTGGVNIRDHAFYSSLAILALYRDVSKSERREYEKILGQNLKKFRKWNKHAPMNNEHRLALIEAERARVLGNLNRAEVLYESAIELSKKNEYLIEEAIANELAGKSYLSRGNSKFAKVYLQEAYACYARWGALAKLKQLQELYPELLSQFDKDSISRNIIPDKSTSIAASQIIDINTVVKASQAISGEVDLGKLLVKMMRLAIENAGAQKGFMLLEDNGKYFVEAEGHIDSEEVRVLESIPIEIHEGLSISIVNYVIRKTGLLILDDASAGGDFISDPYIAENKPKSILCIPIVNQGKLTGILYLENNLLTGAFTKERREMLNLLSTQMAISIENAKFYGKLEDKVLGRTKELMESEKRFRDIAFSSADWIWETDKNGVFIYCSEKVEDILGYKPEELYGEMAVNLMAAEEREKARVMLSELKKQGNSIKDLEAWYLSKDGKRKYILTSGNPVFNDQGEFIGYRGVDKDITERKEAEIKLNELMKELSRSNQELEQFAYIVSHDLQEPLRKIQRFGDKLKESTAVINDGKSVDYLGRMQNAAERMKNLINGLLNYSRVTTKSHAYENVDLNNIVRDVISDLEIRMRETGARVETGELPVSRADALQMRQLFQNLIGNALKFHRQGVAPEIKVYTLNEEPGNYYRLVVEDNGIGISEKDYDRIFGVFQRLHGISEYEGTGIGLAVCKKIVEHHSWKMELESKLGEGSKFIINILK